MSQFISILRCSFSQIINPSYLYPLSLALKFRYSLVQVLENLRAYESVHKHFTMQLFTNQKVHHIFILYFWHSKFRYSLVQVLDTLRADESFHKHFTMRLFANYRSVIQMRIFSRILYISSCF